MCTRCEALHPEESLLTFKGIAEDCHDYLPRMVYQFTAKCCHFCGCLACGEAFDLEEEVLSHLREHGDCDMGALRQAGLLQIAFLATCAY